VIPGNFFLGEVVMSKVVLVGLVFFLVGCSGATQGLGDGVEQGAARPDSSQQVADPPGEDAGVPAPARDSGAPLPGKDAGADADVAPPIDYSVCGQRCGVVPQQDHGRPVDCGGCAAGQACGDDGHANACGSTCLNLDEDVVACSEQAAAGSWRFQPEWAIPAACGAGPTYKVVSGKLAYRERGVDPTGCVQAYLPQNGHRVTCCP
jgi:hypothetical protein